MHFSLRELILALTLFAIGIPIGWHSLGLYRQEELGESAKRIGTNVVYRFRFDPDTGMFQHFGPPLPVTGERLNEVVGKLVELNNPKFQEVSNAQTE